VFEIKERAGANPPGLVTSTDAEIGHPGRQEPRGFMNIPGQGSARAFAFLSAVLVNTWVIAPGASNAGPIVSVTS